MKWRYLPVVALALAPGIVPGGNDATVNANSSVRDGSAANIRYERGRKIYNFRCYYCHGYSGDARTLSSNYLDPKPLDFTSASPKRLTRRKMLDAVRHGRPGTAMVPFEGILTPAEIESVVDFVRHEFMLAHNQNTRYHIPANGWFDQQRYAAAFPFVTGELALDTSWEKLSKKQRAGKRLFLSACISCHDRAHVADEGPAWEPMALSYPRNNTSLTKPKTDAISGASVFARHDSPPRIGGLSAQQRLGERLYQKNCAFCHGADGTGRNWIGSFLKPHPRDLTKRTGMSNSRLRAVIRDGLPGTTMSAWKSVLTEDQVRAIIAYVTRAFYPSQTGAAPGSRGQ